ncbi:hypothetical protein KP22_03550 [Pectobacterium betavasculorum]|uniref:Gfo/Idh/MocA-like oxidoreductase N-terminal domain-containing protein n=1 Tax=Pectobacterium betavasculorum TaxID=55207 RepID=A0A093TJ47_9GAMM|nr:hypothetical protein KP22_03550 [Pectobacterium betavasculorum]KFX22456.1 hypothetical protein JV35_04615 [Pectobacterium betavasculorum]
MKPQFSSAENVVEPTVSIQRPRIGVVGLGSIAQKAYLPILSQAERWDADLSVLCIISWQRLNNGNQQKHQVTRRYCPCV